MFSTCYLNIINEDLSFVRLFPWSIYASLSVNKKLTYDTITVVLLRWPLRTSGQKATRYLPILREN